MKQTINKGLFIDLCENQMANPFSKPALEAIFDYCDDLDPNMELNVSDIENDFLEVNFFVAISEIGNLYLSKKENEGVSIDDIVINNICTLLTEKYQKHKVIFVNPDFVVFKKNNIN